MRLSQLISIWIIHFLAQTLTLLAELLVYLFKVKNLEVFMYTSKNFHRSKLFGIIKSINCTDTSLLSFYQYWSSLESGYIFHNAIQTQNGIIKVVLVFVFPHGMIIHKHYHFTAINCTTLYDIILLFSERLDICT